MSKLFSLFDRNLKNKNDVVATQPQTLNSISKNEEEQNFLLQKIKELENVKYKVDYSDFKNFIFFNSAVDYFNLTGEKILNEYPYDGSNNLIQSFTSDLDDYQQYVLSVFPKNSGHLKFIAANKSYVAIDDVGLDTAGRQTSALLSPGTGSLSIELWCIPPPVLTGSNDVMVLLQKVTGSTSDGYSVYFSGSKVYFTMNSGSNTDVLSSSFVPSQISYFSFVYDRNLNTPAVSLYTGSVTEFPIALNSASSNIALPIIGGSSKLYFGSGTIAGKNTVPLTGSVDNIRIWNFPRYLSDLTSSFNIRQRAQPNLAGMWTFNEKADVSPTGSNTSSENALVFDYSGHKLHGRIINYFDNARNSGSLLPYDKEDLNLTFNSISVQSYISQQQLSASAYDRDNLNLILRLVPESFLTIDDNNHLNLLTNYLYLVGRYFDKIKVAVDQFSYVLTQNYGEFNQTPDVLLETVAKFFGWEFTGNFLSQDINQYILGKNILKNIEVNKEIDKKLFQIKNEFWKRTLINLMYLYKSKGRPESVKSLLRIHGVNENFVKLKEYGLRPLVGIQTNRIHSEKSVYALTFGSGTLTGSSEVVSPNFSTNLSAFECRVRFPTTSSSGLNSTLTTGSILSLQTSGGAGGSTFAITFPIVFGGSSSNAGQTLYELFYTKLNASDTAGTIFLTGSEGLLSVTGSTFFNNTWLNIAVTRDYLSSSLRLNVRNLDRDQINYTVTSSLSASYLNNSGSQNVILILGSTNALNCQYWMQETRVWNATLTPEELDDHTLNFQSYGRRKLTGNSDLALHWRLNEGNSADNSGTLNGNILDLSGNNLFGSGSGFIPNINPYKKFLNDYNFIPPIDFGWNEQMVRVLPTSKVKKADAFSGNRLVALEFNMIDALNEDISQIISSLDNFNYSIGLPVNRFRNSYQDLESLKKLYFKKLQGRLNFRIFADMLEFFDRSFIDMVRKLIPQRSTFLGDQFVIESPFLERPKYQWGYRRQDKSIIPEGVVVVYRPT